MKSKDWRLDITPQNKLINIYFSHISQPGNDFLPKIGILRGNFANDFLKMSLQCQFDMNADEIIHIECLISNVEPF